MRLSKVLSPNVFTYGPTQGEFWVHLLNCFVDVSTYPHLNGNILPICSMYGIFTYIWVITRANVGKYTIHGAYGLYTDIQIRHPVSSWFPAC